MVHISPLVQIGCLTSRFEMWASVSNLGRTQIQFVEELNAQGFSLNANVVSFCFGDFFAGVATRSG